MRLAVADCDAARWSARSVQGAVGSTGTSCALRRALGSRRDWFGSAADGFDGRLWEAVLSGMTVDMR
jgi:hypothetical protein